MSGGPKKQKEHIIKLLSEKSVMKQNVFANTINVFEQLKQSSRSIANELASDIKGMDSRVTLGFKEFNQYSFQVKIAGDMLQFDMHTNVFEFERSHPIYKSSYIKKNDLNSFCGIISVYNFLSDSFKYNRINDVGFLIARIFINREKKFFIETRTSLNAKYGNYSEDEISNDNIADIINELIIFAISFDLFIPPYDAVKQVSVMEIQEKASSTVLKTGKRLGYIGSSESDTNFEDDANL
ncbi:MAG: hypothetical protein IT564_12435 [Rhodospirillales bacterium]|nr:hypothetical protein [Rhodospirillales bacterium]